MRLKVKLDDYDIAYTAINRCYRQNPADHDQPAALKDHGGKNKNKWCRQAAIHPAATGITPKSSGDSPDMLSVSGRSGNMHTISPDLQFPDT